MLVAIDLQSEQDFMVLSANHFALLSARFPAVSFLEILDQGHSTEALKTVEVYFGWRFLPEWFAVAPSLRWIASPAAGTDHLPLEEAKERGVIVTRSFGFHGKPMAEHVMGLVLGFARGLFLGQSRQRTDQWWKSEVASTFFDVSGSTMTIVGCGSVGDAVARLAHACGMSVIGVRRTPPAIGDDASSVGLWFDVSRMEEALERSHVVVNLLPATDQTVRFFDARKFAAMPRGTIFISVSRGSTVDEPALLDALDVGRISWCGLDVTARRPPHMDDPLRRHPRVVLTPKTSAFRRDYMDHAVEFFAENLERYRAGFPLRGLATLEESADSSLSNLYRRFC